MVGGAGGYELCGAGGDGVVNNNKKKRLTKVSLYIYLYF